MAALLDQPQRYGSHSGRRHRHRHRRHLATGEVVVVDAMSAHLQSALAPAEQVRPPLYGAGGGPVDDRTTSAGERRRVPAVPLSPSIRAVRVRPATCPTSAMWLSIDVSDRRSSRANTVLS